MLCRRDRSLVGWSEDPGKRLGPTEVNMKIQDLTLEERLKLVEDIWDSIAVEQEALPLTSEQRRELSRRLELYRVDGNRGAPAGESIERIRRRL